MFSPWRPLCVDLSVGLPSLGVCALRYLRTGPSSPPLRPNGPVNCGGPPGRLHIGIGRKQSPQRGWLQRDHGQPVGRGPGKRKRLLAGRWSRLGREGRHGDRKAMVDLILSCPVPRPPVLHPAQVPGDPRLDAKLLVQLTVQAVLQPLPVFPVPPGKKVCGCPSARATSTCPPSRITPRARICVVTMTECTYENCSGEMASISAP